MKWPLRCAPVLLVVVLAGCKSMGGVASGVGKVAGGFGHVASHAAGAELRVRHCGEAECRSQ